MWKCKEWWNIQLTSGIWCGLLSQHPLPPARHQPHFLIPYAQTTNQKKAKNPEMRFNSQQIVSYCLGLRTQNPGLREVDLEPSSKRGSDKINMLKQGRKTVEENKSYRTAWTHTYGYQHLQRSVSDFKLSKSVFLSKIWCVNSCCIFKSAFVA